MPSTSKSQQHFFGMVHAIQKGKLSPDHVGGKVRDAAKKMKKQDVTDFASTSTKGLPEHAEKKADDTLSPAFLDTVKKMKPSHKAQILSMLQEDTTKKAETTHAQPSQPPNGANPSQPPQPSQPSNEVTKASSADLGLAKSARRLLTIIDERLAKPAVGVDIGPSGQTVNR